MTDGGLETTLIFHDGFDLPEFAAVDLLRSEEGTEALRSYYARYAELARELGVGFVLESPTWRASPAWAARLGYSVAELDALNRASIALMEEIRERYESPETPFVISGCIGPQGDGYAPDELLSAEAAESYHSVQIATFAETAADMVTAITMTYAAEAVGILRASSSTRASRRDLVHRRNRRSTPERPSARRGDRSGRPRNGARGRVLHDQLRPSHALRAASSSRTRRGWRACAGYGRTRRRRATQSWTKPTELDDGDPDDLARRHGSLRLGLPALSVVGGCCGTDHRHVAAICRTLL